MKIAHLAEGPLDYGGHARPRQNILVISGSPTVPSKTEHLASTVAAGLGGQAESVVHIKLRCLPGVPLIEMNSSDPYISAAIEAVANADGIVIVTPTYKASFSGLLKLFLDILPQFALADKIVLPLATGGSLAHVLALDYGLRPVLQSMGARWVVPGYFIAASAFVSTEGDITLTPQFSEGLEQAVLAFSDALASRTGKAP